MSDTHVFLSSLPYEKKRKEKKRKVLLKADLWNQTPAEIGNYPSRKSQQICRSRRSQARRKKCWQFLFLADGERKKEIISLKKT